MPSLADCDMHNVLGGHVRDESEKEDGDRLKGSVVCDHYVYHLRSLSPEQGLG